MRVDGDDARVERIEEEAGEVPVGIDQSGVLIRDLSLRCLRPDMRGV